MYQVNLYSAVWCGQVTGDDDYLFVLNLGSGSLAAMAVFESRFKANMEVFTITHKLMRNAKLKS